MKTVTVTSRFGRKVPITVLTDLDLIFCLPVFLLSVIGRYVVLPVYNMLLTAISSPLLVVMGHMDRSKLRFVFSLNVICVPGIFYLFLESPRFASSFDWLLLGLLLMIVGSLIKVLSHAQQTYGGLVPPGKGTAGGETFNDFFIENAERMNKYLFDDKFTQYLVFVNLLVTVFFIMILSFAWLATDINTGLHVTLLFLASMFIVLLINQPIEHMAAHTPEQRVLRPSKVKTMGDKFFYALELVRIYVVWPIAFFMPGCYHFAHRLIHHREVNGPADYLSTQRYDRTSLFGFMKATTWYSVFTRLVPVDCFHYFKAHYYNTTGEKLVYKQYRNGFLMGLVVFGLFAWIFPGLAILSVLIIMMSGLNNQLNMYQQHGFHDATKPYEVKAACNSPIHCGHHINSNNIHMILSAEHARHFWWHREENPTQYPIFVTTEAKNLFKENWFHIESRLWQGKLNVINNLIVTNETNAAAIKKFVVGAKLVKQSDFAAKLDNTLSEKLGAIVERFTRQMIPRNDQQFLDKQSSRTVVNKRVANFYNFIVKDGQLPPGMY